MTPVVGEAAPGVLVGTAAMSPRKTPFGSTRQPVPTPDLGDRPATLRRLCEGIDRDYDSIEKTVILPFSVCLVDIIGEKVLPAVADA